jgi:hypothetical protein
MGLPGTENLLPAPVTAADFWAGTNYWRNRHHPSFGGVAGQDTPAARGFQLRRLD